MDPSRRPSALAVCAGADGSLAPTRRSRRANGGWRCEARGTRRATARGEKGEEGRERKGARRASRELAGARMDAAVCRSLVDSTSAPAPAMRAMRSVTDAGVDALREAGDGGRRSRRGDSARAKRSETAAKTVELKPGRLRISRSARLSARWRASRRAPPSRSAGLCGSARQWILPALPPGRERVRVQPVDVALPAGVFRRGESAEDAAARRVDAVRRRGRASSTSTSTTTTTGILAPRKAPPLLSAAERSG